MERPVALITGAASGIGRAVCRALAARDHLVIAADIDLPGAELVAAEVEGRAVELDVRELAANEAAVAFTLEQAGRLDHIFLNAGISTGTGFGDEFDLETYRRAMSINLDGVVFGLQAALPALKATEGSAVATASLAGLTPVPMDPFYAANKHAVVGLVRSAGPALQVDGVRLNAICPGFTESAIIAPIRDGLLEGGVPIIETAVVADAVVSLLEAQTVGDCVFVQSGRPPAPFAFRNIPGPRPIDPEAVS
ncbi:MAG: SDR family NAD(P)-dependent oxidoreductase [Solirubrobacterales bacterium]|nr:SDR family NAD(P)-dependent oxidoreductase [Solirubrobacterales bacterium]